MDPLVPLSHILSLILLSPVIMKRCIYLKVRKLLKFGTQKSLIHMFVSCQLEYFVKLLFIKQGRKTLPCLFFPTTTDKEKAL
jgi:hypothetical protein